MAGQGAYALNLGVSRVVDPTVGAQAALSSVANLMQARQDSANKKRQLELEEDANRRAEQLANIRQAEYDKKVRSEKAITDANINTDKDINNVNTGTYNKAYDLLTTEFDKGLDKLSSKYKVSKEELLANDKVSRNRLVMAGYKPNEVTNEVDKLKSNYDKALSNINNRVTTTYNNTVPDADSYRSEYIRNAIENGAGPKDAAVNADILASQYTKQYSDADKARMDELNKQRSIIMKLATDRNVRNTSSTTTQNTTSDGKGKVNKDYIKSFNKFGTVHNSPQPLTLDDQAKVEKLINVNDFSDAWNKFSNETNDAKDSVKLVMNTNIGTKDNPLYPDTELAVNILNTTNSIDWKGNANLEITSPQDMIRYAAKDKAIKSLIEKAKVGTTLKSSLYQPSSDKSKSSTTSRTRNSGYTDSVKVFTPDQKKRLASIDKELNSLTNSNRTAKASDLLGDLTSRRKQEEYAKMFGTYNKNKSIKKSVSGTSSNVKEHILTKKSKASKKVAPKDIDKANDIKLYSEEYITDKPVLTKYPKTQEGFNKYAKDLASYNAFIKETEDQANRGIVESNKITSRAIHNDNGYTELSKLDTNGLKPEEVIALKRSISDNNAKIREKIAPIPKAKDYIVNGKFDIKSFIDAMRTRSVLLQDPKK